MKKNNYILFPMRHTFFENTFTSAIFFFFHRNLNEKNLIQIKKIKLFLKRKIFLFLELDNIFNNSFLKKFNCGFVYQFDSVTLFFLTFKNNFNKFPKFKENSPNFNIFFQKNWFFFLQQYYSKKNYLIKLNFGKITNEKKNFYLIFECLINISTKMNFLNIILLGNFLKKFSQITTYFGLFELYALYHISIKLNFGKIITLNKNLFYFICFYYLIKKKIFSQEIKKTLFINFFK
jgi:hypothetical protein